MFILNTKPVQKNQYIKCNAFENLTVVPYMRGRLVFAELAARAIEEGEFDTVVVDLPYFMNGKTWLDIPIRLFPYVSSLVLKKPDSTLINFPFVPNDAACAAVAAAKGIKDGSKSIDIQCIDDSNVIHYPPDCFYQPVIRVKDDYFVFIEGIENYYRPLFSQLDQTWQQLSTDHRFFFEYRAGIMSERIKECLRQGRNTLFVCEYRIWWLISKLLGSQQSGRVNQFYYPWKDMSAALVIGDPYLFWANGMLDDYPLIVSLFCERLHLGLMGSFDKLQTIDGIIGSMIEARAKQGLRHPSVRELILFQNYFTKRLKIKRICTPSFLSDLYESVSSCLGKGFAREMARQLLNYPYPEKDEVLGYFNIQYDNVIEGFPFGLPDLSEIACFHTGTTVYSQDQFYGNSMTSNTQMDFVSRNYPYINKKESKELGETSGMIWAVAEDYRLHETACAKVRNIVAKKRHKEVIKKSHGFSGDGIHWKATLAARAKGENAIYIRAKKEPLKGKIAVLDEYTPVVFLFSNEISKDYVQTISDFNITQRLTSLGEEILSFDTLPSPDFVYSILYTNSARQCLCKGHISKVRLSSIAFIYTRYSMGVERYTAITKKPEKFQCRSLPFNDPELKGFSHSEIGIAWAIKYAKDIVLIVAGDGWKASTQLDSFARAKSVSINYISLSNFSEDFIERLRTLHFISTFLKKYSNCDKILRRFLEL